MGKHISISPLTRIEGHLAVHAEVEPVGGAAPADAKKASGAVGHRVSQARCEGEMFRGFETILEGRDPLDAQQITQRICGVCPISHGMASVQAQEEAYGIQPNHNGRLLQNLILAANYIQSHLVHFYHLAALDFVDITAILKYTGRDRTLRALKSWVEMAIKRGDAFAGAPFLPRYEVPYIQDNEANWALLGSYVKALEMRALSHEAAAVFGAKLPHSTSLVPGGCTQVPTMERILAYRSRLNRMQAFVEDVYLPDLKAVAGAFPALLEEGVGYPNFLSYGVFREDRAGTKWIGPGALIDGRWEALDPDQITEQVRHSRFASASGLHPRSGNSRIAPDKAEAYSWLKAPRYKGLPMEVGPLARALVNYHRPGGSWIKTEVDATLKALGLKMSQLHSVVGRHLVRGLEAQWIGRQAHQWLDQVTVDGSPANDEYEMPKTAQGMGLTEAPRGALGHWISIAEYRIERYQCVVPTTWNCSPRDDREQPGPVEKALEGIPVGDPTQPMEVARVVRSFDPCLACAIH